MLAEEMSKVVSQHFDGEDVLKSNLHALERVRKVQGKIRSCVQSSVAILNTKFCVNLMLIISTIYSIFRL
jgi:hypothetical protein